MVQKIDECEAIIDYECGVVSRLLSDLDRLKAENDRLRKSLEEIADITKKHEDFNINKTHLPEMCSYCKAYTIAHKAITGENE